MKKKIQYFIVGILVIGIIFAVSKYVPLLRYRKAINDIKIENVDTSKIKDGTYRGEKKAIWVEAEVEVKVEDHKIRDINLIRHKYGRDQAKEAEIVIEKVLKEQKLDVDTVSGSTSSSKVILEAIENALKSAE